MSLKKTLYIIFFLFISLVVTIVATIVFYKTFTLKKVEIERNFHLDKESFLKYLGIKYNRFIFIYSVKEMEEKIENLPNIIEFGVKTKYPDTIKITILKITPIAKTLDRDNNVLFLDKSGKILKDYSTNQVAPFIITDDRENIEKNEKLKEVADILSELKVKNNKIYSSIKKITIKENKRVLTEYFVNYSLIESNLYLKNFINVDLLRGGYLASSYMKENGLEPESIVYNSFGFVY